MNQLIIECSEPGIVISLCEELENIFRNMTFQKVQELAKSLEDIASQLGPEYEKAWQGFGIEVSNESGGYPPSFGKRDVYIDDTKDLKKLLHEAEKKGIGKFKISSTSLLDQSGPPPETREQYIDDLADSISNYRQDWELFQNAKDIPDPILNHRKKLLNEHGNSLLSSRALDSSIGKRWIEDSVKYAKEIIQEVDSRTNAVIEYELDRLIPSDFEASECIQWVMLACKAGRYKSYEKWLDAACGKLPYLYQKSLLIQMLGLESKRIGSARPLLENKMKEIIELSKSVYTEEGVAALQIILEELCESPWGMPVR